MKGIWDGRLSISSSNNVSIIKFPTVGAKMYTACNMLRRHLENDSSVD